MKRRGCLVGLVFLLVPGLSIGLVWTLLTPVYRATAEVRICPTVPVLVFETEDNGPIRSYESFVNTQISIVKSPAVIQRVLDRTEVQQTAWYRRVADALTQRSLVDSPARQESLISGLSVQHRPGTEILDLSFEDTCRDDALVILDALLEQYISYSDLRSDAVRDAMYRKLIEQQQTLQREISGQEAGIGALRRALGAGDPEEVIAARKVRLDETQNRITEGQHAIALLEWEIEQAKGGRDVPRDDLPSLKHEQARAKKQEQLLKDELAKQQAQFDRLFADARLLDNENRQLQRKRQLLDAVQKRIDEREMERDVAAPIEVLTRAYASSRPYRDRRTLFTALTWLLGLLAAGVTTFVTRKKPTATAQAVAEAAA